MGSALTGFKIAFEEGIGNMIGSDVFHVSRFEWASKEPWWKRRNRKRISWSDAERFQKEIQSRWPVGLEIRTQSDIKYQEKSASGVAVFGSNHNGLLISGGLVLDKGRYFSEFDIGERRSVCVIGDELRRQLFGDGNGLGNHLTIGRHRYFVIGTLKKVGESMMSFGNPDNRITIPITRLIQDFMFRPDITIGVKVGDPESMPDAFEEVRGAMRKIRGLAPADSDDFGINQASFFQDQFVVVRRNLALGGFFITGLSLFVGGIGIMNVMLVSVAERTSEIGLRKAIGAKRQTIMIQFLTESVLISLIGGFIGIVGAVSISMMIHRFSPLPATVSLPVVVAACSVSVLTGIFSGLVPAYRAAVMPPVEALRQD